MKWSDWRSYFERNRLTPRPDVSDAGIPPDPTLRRCLARSLAVFQLGEAGEGRIAKEAWRFATPHVDDDWRVALGHWVREEGRHARILGDCVRALGGKLITKNWTNGLWVFGRRLMGVRLKLLVVLAAEVIGITYYGLIASKLPPSAIASALAMMAAEEERHLAFHVRFFRLEMSWAGPRILFWSVWLPLGVAAGLAVLVDHAATFRRLGIDRWDAGRRFVRLVVETGRAVTRRTPQPLRAVEVPR